MLDETLDERAIPAGAPQTADRLQRRIEHLEAIVTSRDWDDAASLPEMPPALGRAFDALARRGDGGRAGRPHRPPRAVIPEPAAGRGSWPGGRAVRGGPCFLLPCSTCSSGPRWPSRSRAAWLTASTQKRRRLAGFGLFLVSNALWIAWGWSDAAWALVALQTFLVVTNIRGVVDNRDAGATAHRETDAG